ncbi:Mu tail sheath family protein [Xanthobacter versatilis]|uniref:Mu tail sheath family protein n=1 Tax=Xanthobacter autotrophicus (strain ATCC BAA-1158 / Py2) TaxID=78245 RepID=A7INW5_XANP2|nr:Mu tail sheath family protein [Xanthobacter autotrophicus Py2]
MTISFDEIPYDWLKPGNYTEVKANYDRMGKVAYPARTLLITQKLAAGSAAALQQVRITRPDQGRALFGAGSVGADMVETYKLANKTGDLYAIGVADAGTGVAATGSFTFAGAGGGPLPLYVGKVRIPLAVTAAMTAAQIASAAAAAINAVATLPVTAVAALAVCTITAKHKGEVGNGLQLAVARRQGDSVPAGLTVTVAPLSGGANNPDITPVLDAIAAQWFSDIVVPWDDATTLTALAANLAARYQAMGKKDGHLYVGHAGTFGALTTKGGLTNAPQISGMGAKASPSPPWVWAASLAGVAAFQLANDPARQLRTLALPGVEAPAEADRFSDTEQDLLLKGGISTFNVSDDGTVSIDRVVTTYKVSPLGVTDRAWLDIMVPKTMSRVRYDWASYVSLLYPRSKLAEDGSLAAEADDSGVVVTPMRMHGSWSARCQKYERWGWLQNTKETVRQSVFAIDDTDNDRLNARQQVNIIGNMMVLASSLEFWA